MYCLVTQTIRLEEPTPPLLRESSATHGTYRTPGLLGPMDRPTSGGLVRVQWRQLTESAVRGQMKWTVLHGRQQQTTFGDVAAHGAEAVFANNQSVQG